MAYEKGQLKTGIILNYVNMILGNLIPVFYTPIMLSLLGKSEYGLYKIAGSVTSYLSLISLGIGSAITRYLIKAYAEEGKEAEERVLGLFMIIFQIIAVAALLVGSILAFNLHVWYSDSLTQEELQRMRGLVLILSVNTALNLSLSPYVTVVSAHEKFIFLQCMNIITTCVAPIVNILVLFLGYKSVGMALSSLALGVVMRLIYFVFVRVKLGIHARYKQLPRNLLKEILVFSFWIFIANVVNQLYNTTDTVMIGAVPNLGTDAAAVYNIGAVFNSIVFSLSVGFSSLLTPKANKMVFSGASKAELTDLAIRVGRIQCYIVALIITGFIAFGKPFISLYAGEGYQDSYWVAVLMMIPSSIPLVQSVCLSIIIAQNKHKFRSLVYLGIAILNVIGTWYLMHTRLGIVGAALMTGVATVLGQGLAMNWFYWKKTELELGRFWRSIGSIYVIPAAMCAFTLAVSRWIDFNDLRFLILGILFYTFVYCLLNWRFVMNQNEKALVLPFLKKDNMERGI